MNAEQTMQSTSPLASILMPVYNQEEFLRQALESAQKQTVDDIEIVCVDDGSTDSSPAILRQAARTDPRVRVIRQRNQGVSAARNTALATARGRYIFFCDPDDVMAPRLLETTINALRRYHADVCSFAFRAVSRQGRPLASRYRHNTFAAAQARSITRAKSAAPTAHATSAPSPTPRVQILTPEQAIREQYRGRIGGYLWAFVAKRSVYERAKVVFPVGRRIEDQARICQILGSARRIVRITATLYSYRLHPGSLLGSPDPSLIRDWFRAQKDRDDWVVAHYPDLAGFMRLRHLDVLGSLDYESMRQSLEFGLRLDPDSVALRRSTRQSKRWSTRQSKRWSTRQPKRR